MRKFFLILANEVYMIVRQPFFWFVLLGIPLMAFLGFSRVTDSIDLDTNIPLINSITDPLSETMEDPKGELEKLVGAEEDPRPDGFVDPGHLAQAFPPDFPTQDLILYPDTAAAQEALEAGKIRAYYIIEPDYPQSGRLTIHMLEYNMVNATSDHALENLMNYNLLGRDVELYRKVTAPLQNLTTESIAPPESAAREDNSQAALGICFTVMTLFSTGILGSATLLLNGLSMEKGNRMIEMLLVSANPMQLLCGKIVGLGLMGLLQTVVWSLSMLATMRVGGEAMQLPAEMQLRTSFFGWGIAFFLFGYLMYAAIMASIGTLITDLRESSQLTLVAMFPVILSEMLMVVIIDDPHGVVAVFFSLFPLTAPFITMMRFAVAEVPLWQMLLSLASVGMSALLIIRMAAGLFRAQQLLTGKPLNFSTIFKLLRSLGTRKTHSAV